MNLIPHELGALAEDIEMMFHLSGYDPPQPIERIVPDGSLNLVIELDGQDRFVVAKDSAPEQRCIGSWVSGIHQRPISIRVPGASELIAVRFAPGRAQPLLGTALSELTDRVVPAIEVVGDSITDVRQRAVSAESSAAKMSVVADWLTARKLAAPPPPDSLTDAVAQIRANPTVATLADLHQVAGVSSTHLVSLFRKYVGVRPKTFQRILRFSAIVAALASDDGARDAIDWPGLSVECGYYDQSHLIRDFSLFSGFRPTEFLSRGDDRLNFFPIEE